MPGRDVSQAAICSEDEIVAHVCRAFIGDVRRQNTAECDDNLSLAGDGYHSLDIGDDLVLDLVGCAVDGGIPWRIEVPRVVHADLDHDKPGLKLQDIGIEATPNKWCAVAADAPIDDEARRALKKGVERPPVGDGIADEDGVDQDVLGQMGFVMSVEDTSPRVGRRLQTEETRPDDRRPIQIHLPFPLYLRLYVQAFEVVDRTRAKQAQILATFCIPNSIYGIVTSCNTIGPAT